MRLPEHRGKALFRAASIPIPESILLEEASLATDIPFSQSVVKAQVLSGKRKKRGLIKQADTPEDAATQARQLLGSTADEETISAVLVEERVVVEEEYYLSISLDRAARQYVLLFSDTGGIDIETVSEDSIQTYSFFDIAEIRDNLPEAVQPIAEKLFAVMQKHDCRLVEINPLAQTPDGLIALDAKVVIDDNAMFRQDIEVVTEEKTALEQRAEDAGLHFVSLDGTIGIIGNGAGLVLSTLDIVQHFGGTPANFLDVGGGASVEKMEAAFDIVLSQNVEAIFINIFGGITHCDDIAEGIVHFMKTHEKTVPLVVRMIGTNEEEGREILEENGIHALTSMEHGAKKVVELVS